MRSTVSKTKSASPEAIIAFFKRRKPGSVFTRAQLISHVTKSGNVSEETATRSLRNLRAQGVVDYECVDPVKSKYKVTYVP